MLIDLKRSAPPPDWGVRIDHGALERMAEQVVSAAFPEPGSDIPTLPTDDPPSRWCTFIGLSVSVLACLWPPEGEAEWHIDWRGRQLSDAPALFGCFRRGLKRTASGYDLESFVDWTDADASAFFAGSGVFQLIPERAERLRHVARAVREGWDGSFLALVEEARFEAEGVVRLLEDRVPGYRDEAVTPAGVLRFAKLARLSTALMAQRLGKPLQGLDDFPVYPDYMLPKVFRHEGVLVYSEELARTVDSRGLVPKDSPWEHALRWGTIRAAELLRTALGARGQAVTGPRLDFALWHSGVLGPDAKAMGEHHRTITMAY